MAKILAKIAKSEAFVGSAHSAETIKRKARERSSCGQKCTRMRCAQVKIVKRKCVERRKYSTFNPL